MATSRWRTGTPVTSRPSTVTRPADGCVQPRHHPHQRCLAGLRGAQQYRHRAGYQLQVDRVQMHRGTVALLHALQAQFHAAAGSLQGAAALAVAAGGAPVGQCAVHQSTTRARSAAL